MRLFQLLSWGILIYIGYRIVLGFVNSKKKEAVPPPAAAGEETRRDPVCGTFVSASDAVIGRNGDERLFFCSMGCLEKYKDQLAQQHTANIEN
jgi:YHS domain-containing protein